MSGVMRVVREHGMSQQEAKVLVVENLPSLFERIIEVIEEIVWSEEGIQWVADNYWSAESLDEQDAQVDEDFCEMCGQLVVVLNEGPMSNGETFRIGQCPCCGDSNCPHRRSRGGLEE